MNCHEGYCSGLVYETTTNMDFNTTSDVEMEWNIALLEGKDYTEDLLDDSKEQTDDDVIYGNLPPENNECMDEENSTLDCQEGIVNKEGEMLEETASCDKNEDKASFLYHRFNGALCSADHRLMKKMRGGLLKGILAPPVVDRYIKDIWRVLIRQRWNWMLEKKKYKIGHNISEAITSLYTLMRNCDIVLPQDEQVKLLLRYAAACLCNALFAWRRQRRDGILHKLISSKHWWLCKEREHRGSKRLFGKAMAKNLAKYVFTERSSRIADILQREIQSCNDDSYFHKKNDNEKHVLAMERWVENGCDVLDEYDMLQEKGLSVQRFILPTMLDPSVFHRRQFRDSNGRKKNLSKKEYRICCDLTNAANALATVFYRLSRDCVLFGQVEAAAHTVCKALYNFDCYRRTSFLRALGFSQEKVDEFLKRYPLENDGKLLGESLLNALKY